MDKVTRYRLITAQFRLTHSMEGAARSVAAFNDALVALNGQLADELPYNDLWLAAHTDVPILDLLAMREEAASP